MRRLAYLLASCMLVAGAAQARKIDDRVSYQLTVTDAAGQPVAGARVWTLGDSLVRTDLRAADLARLVSRYGQDVDFVFNGDLHPDLEVWMTDSQGRVHLEYRASEVAGLKKARRHFAVFKRGFATAQFSDETPNNSERKIPVPLVPDPRAKVGERLLELDSLHARARTIASGKVNLEMAAALKAVDAEIRALAQDLEKRGFTEEAAVAYAVLANLPSVDTGKDSEGRPIIIGVTHYFRGSSPARVADLDRATKLQRSHPMLEYQSMWTRYLGKKLDPLAWGSVPLRAEYLQELRALQAAHGERLWPESQYFLWQALIREKDFAAACDALRAYHAYEPSLYHRERWLRLSNQYRGDVGNAGGPADARCELPLPRK